MKCPACGRESGMEAVNYPIDEDFRAATGDRLRGGGTCPVCNHLGPADPPATVAPQSKPASPMKNFRAKVAVGGVIVVTLVRLAAQYYQSPLRTVPIDDAVRRATADPRVQGELGLPIRAGRAVRDKVFRDETGWSEAKLTIPLTGSRRKGVLKVVAGKGTGPWILSTLDVQVEAAAKTIDLLAGNLKIADSPDYQSIHTQRPEAPQLLDLPPAAPTWDGSYPVVEIRPQPGGGMAAASGVTFVTLAVHDRPADTFQVDLTTGCLLVRQTDLLVDDVMPLVLTRTYVSWDSTGRAFGLGTNHPYDIAPEGTRNPYTYMEIHLEDSGRVHFDRISRGTGYADAVYEHRRTSSEFFNARIWWNGDGWTLKFADGRAFLFPESYSAQTMAQGAPYEMRDAAGHSVRLQRDPERNLRLLVSPNGHFIRFEYDELRHITDVTDDRGRTVRYEYDSSGRLIRVIGADGHEARFAYDEGRMVTIRDGSDRVLLENRYENGRVVEQDLAGGAVYRYQYQLANGRVSRAMVIGPDGVRTLTAWENGAWRSRLAGLLHN